MTAASGPVPEGLPAWTVHPEHVRAAVNIHGLGVGVTPAGTVLVDTEPRLLAADAELVLLPERIGALVTAWGVPALADAATTAARLTRDALVAVR